MFLLVVQQTKNLSNRSKNTQNMFFQNTQRINEIQNFEASSFEDLQRNQKA